MNLKNKMSAAVLCALVAGIGIFGTQTGIANAQEATGVTGVTGTTNNAMLSITQLQQIIAGLQQQIQQIIQILSQRNQLPANKICVGQDITFSDTNKQCCAGLEKIGASACPSGQACTAVESYICVKKPLTDICKRTLSGSPTTAEKEDCANANGTIYCGNGWCSCSCKTVNCAKEGESATGSVAPEYSRSCCAGLDGFNPAPMPGSGSLCYNPAKGKPVCKSQGTRSEGWYYSNGTLLKYFNCSQTSCAKKYERISIGSTKTCCSGLIKQNEYQESPPCASNCPISPLIGYFCDDPAVCGNKSCEATKGETAANCATDCN